MRRNELKTMKMKIKITSRVIAAGVLMGLHNGLPMKACLELGVCAGASSLFAATSSDGILPAGECRLLVGEYGFRNETIKI